MMVTVTACCPIKLSVGNTLNAIFSLELQLLMIYYALSVLFVEKEKGKTKHFQMIGKIRKG